MRRLVYLLGTVGLLGLAIGCGNLSARVIVRSDPPEADVHVNVAEGYRFLEGKTPFDDVARFRAMMAVTVHFVIRVRKPGHRVAEARQRHTYRGDVSPWETIEAADGKETLDLDTGALDTAIYELEVKFSPARK